ncbi:MAG TPA: hypothetical protein VGO58_01570 [Chitinophagaceae bacterium]|jgi:hypothetical protein|nr:hypothetical protein [Chitinophagaceae bacterium]
MKNIIIILFVVLGVCNGSSLAQLRVHNVLPSITDPAIDTYTSPGDEHYIYVNDSVPPLNKLFVFFPGTLGRGKNPKLIVPFAAAVGYHAIALTYPSDVALAQVCRNNDDKDCFDKGRQEICFGDDVSADWNVNKANSIENRLLKLLIYLADKYPGDNWRQFITGNKEINWEKTCLSGQSQGGGHAAYIAQKKKVGRVIMFASPKDYSLVFNEPATFLHHAMATPINRFFGFVHTDDDKNGCTWAEQKEIFTLMGLDKLGQWENVDQSIPPYNHSRTLTSTKAQGFPHGSVIGDIEYRIVWKYMMLEEVK